MRLLSNRNTRKNFIFFFVDREYFILWDLIVQCPNIRFTRYPLLWKQCELGNHVKTHFLNIRVAGAVVPCISPKHSQRECLGNVREMRASVVVGTMYTWYILDHYFIMCS
uniref:Uncharacterized protein n=1 Tax=Cacopsylla melanoneura TaxID=428564 RepID=A0A8D8QE39_9HEMI